MTLSPCMAFLSVGSSGGEMLMVFVVVLLLFGPRRLPEIARGIGKALEILRKTSQDFKDQVMRIDEEQPQHPVLPVAEPAVEPPKGEASPPDVAPADQGAEKKDSGNDYAG